MKKNRADNFSIKSMLKGLLSFNQFDVKETVN